MLPFCLRRTKESVLTELPPKLIEDRLIELHPIQRELYTAVAAAVNAAAATPGTLVAAGTDSESSDSQSAGAARHVFSALQYLRRVCNHPLLAVGAQHPQHAHYEQLAARSGGLHALECAPKLLALQQLLFECGIGDGVDGVAGVEPPSGSDEAMGEDESSSGGGTTGTAVATHRALIFSQSGALLDLVESDLLRAYMPSVSYLRLDGRVAAQQRAGLAHRFNSDPSVDLMLLTTTVGGLGLNLTGADTVIFLDHDWNPMKDLQAMDRAHRIGQTKVVSVYRLVTRDTLEEKIMSLQAFKRHVAQTVVSQQNASLATMNTEQLLDLFAFSPGTTTSHVHASASLPADGGTITGDDAVGAVEAADGARRAGGGRLGNVLEGLGELWDEEQYEEQFSLDRFLEGIRGKP